MRLRAMAGWYIGLLDPGGRETLSVGGEFSGRESLGRELISSVIYKRVNFGQKIGRIGDRKNTEQAGQAKARRKEQEVPSALLHYFSLYSFSIEAKPISAL